MAEYGFYHVDRGYWQSIAGEIEDLLPKYPQGTINVPLKPSSDHQWINNQWTYIAPLITHDQIDAERDDRTYNRFKYQNVYYQLDEKSISRITAMGADARFAVLGGAQPGNLRWADPEIDFGWIATDNGITPMDAQTMIDFSTAAKLWVSKHTFAGLNLKGFDPIPQDYTDDKYWP